VGSVALDANVVIGLLDPSDALHDRAVTALEAWVAPEHRWLMPASVYVEVLVHPLERDAAAVVDDFFDRGGIEIVAIDRPLARLAAELRGSVGVGLGDAMYLAVALARGAHALTFDAPLARAWERVR
jgi:predicted nucleic acid-binding protein